MRNPAELAQGRLEGPLTEEATLAFEAYCATVTAQKAIGEGVPTAAVEDLYGKQDEVDEVVDGTNISTAWCDEVYLRAQDAVVPPSTEKVRVPAVIGAFLLGTLLSVGSLPSAKVSHKFRRQANALKAQKNAKES